MTGALTEATGAVLVVVSAAAAAAFVALYALRSPWWLTAFGRAILTLGVGWSLVLFSMLVGHEGPWLVTVWLTGLALTSFGGWALVAETVAAQRSAGPGPGEPVVESVVSR